MNKEKLEEMKRRINDPVYLQSAKSALAMQITEYVFDKPDVLLTLQK